MTTNKLPAYTMLLKHVASGEIRVSLFLTQQFNLNLRSFFIILFYPPIQFHLNIFWNKFDLKVFYKYFKAFMLHTFSTTYTYTCTASKEKLFFTSDHSFRTISQQLSLFSNNFSAVIIVFEQLKTCVHCFRT